jgi:hypothetical protein
MSEKEVETAIEIPNEIPSKHRKSIDQIFVSQYMNDTSTYIEEKDDYVVTYSEEDKETKDDVPDETEKHRKPEMKDDILVKSEKHRESIDRIIVSQYMNDTSTYIKEKDDYVVTYSEKDNSVLGWSVNIEKNERQHPDVYFKVDQIDNYLSSLKDYRYSSILLSRKILSFYRKDKLCRYLFLLTIIIIQFYVLINNYILIVGFIDLNSDRTNSERFLKLERYVSCEDEEGSFGRDAIGFLPNGDLIQVSLSNSQIYKYCLTDKPTKDTDTWECSQINDIEIPESLYGQVTKLSCSICRTKLFLFVRDSKTLILQFDLLTMNLERQYTSDIKPYWSIPVITNNQTLLAIASLGFFYIFSMENGMLILKHNCGYYFTIHTVYFLI